jgi:hypothetical protein
MTERIPHVANIIKSNTPTAWLKSVAIGRKMYLYSRQIASYVQLGNLISCLHEWTDIASSNVGAFFTGVLIRLGKDYLSFGFVQNIETCHLLGGKITLSEHQG